MRVSLEIGLKVHESKVTCLDACGRSLSSGSADESLRVFDLRSRRAVGSLQQHSGTVLCQAFVPPGRSLLSGGEDGSIIVWRCSDWVSLLVMKGHKGGVVALAAHPSGRIALSVGRDRTLRLWDLTKGRQVHQQALGCATEGREALWSPDGSLFLVLFDSSVCVHSGEDGSLLQTVVPPVGRGVGAANPNPRLNTMRLLRGATGSTSVLAVACEGGDVLLWDVASLAQGAVPPCAVLPTGHSKRGKCLAAIYAPLHPEAPQAAGKRKAPKEEEKKEEEEEEDDEAEVEEEEEDDEEGEEDEGEGRGSGVGAPKISGLAKLSAEEVTFTAKGPRSGACVGSSSGLLATVGGDGIVFLWNAWEVAEAVASLCAKPLKKSKKGGDAAASGGSAAAAVDILALQPLATLKAASGIRPTTLASAE